MKLGFHFILKCNKDASAIQYPSDENPDSRRRCVHRQVSAVSRRERLPRKWQQRSGENVANVQKYGVHSYITIGNIIGLLVI